MGWQKDPFCNDDEFSTKNYVILYAGPLGAKNTRVVIALDYTPHHSHIVRLVITLDDRHYELGGVDAWDPELKFLEINDVISVSVREIDHPNYYTLAIVERGSLVKYNFKADLPWLNKRLKYDFGKGVSIISTTKDIEQNLFPKKPSKPFFIKTEIQSEFQLFFFANSPIVRNINRENRYELQYKVGEKRKRVEVLNPQPIIMTFRENDVFHGYALLQCVHGSNTYRIIRLTGNIVENARNQSLIAHRSKNADAATATSADHDPTDDQLINSIDNVFQDEEDDENVNDEYEEDTDGNIDDEYFDDEYDDEYEMIENQYMNDVFDDKKIEKYYERMYEREEEACFRNQMREAEFIAFDTEIRAFCDREQGEEQRKQKLYGLDSMYLCPPINPEYASAENCKTVVKAYKSGEQGIYAENKYGAEFLEMVSADQLPDIDDVW